MIHCGKGSVNSALKARILLKSDVSENGPGWSDERIAEELETSLSTVLRTRRLLVMKGWHAALSRKKSSWSPPRAFDGRQRSKLIALACTKPPQGYAHWTLRLLEQRVVELGIVLRRPATPQIYRVLKENHLNRIKISTGCARPEKMLTLSPQWRTHWKSTPVRLRSGPSSDMPGRNIKAIDPRETHAPFRRGPGREERRLRV